ncbi:MAG: GspE/PulE family protein [Xanthomonadaceae bacterium]|nr:GspE/PulE family protein [Xanthomonadaceae bacterium]
MNADSRAGTLAIGDAQIAAARALARGSGQPLLKILTESTGLSARDVVGALATRFGMPVFEMAELEARTPAFELLSLARALERKALLLREADRSLTGVVSDPFDADLRTWLEARAAGRLRFALVLDADLVAHLVRLEEGARAVQNLVDTQAPSAITRDVAEEISYASATQDASAAVKAVNSTLYDALKAGASDIHLEASETGLTVRYRVDGMLDEAAHVKGVELGEQIISRIKVLAELDIAERRVPQDGSFRVRSGNREIDLRVSVMPSVHGEDAVVRILDKQRMVEASGSLTLDTLGFDASALGTVRELLEQPYGMLLVTGPTGSGKTTTLYAALSEINNGHDKIITIEDPVEYQIRGILQIPVNDKKGLTFARGLRSILRHDPDTIMVGEIRDRETAEIAVQAALTGHLVLTTVHANNVFDVFSRFTHMNLDPYAFASALNGVWAQRLVRRVCPRCGQPHAATPAEAAALGPAFVHAGRPPLRRGPGCGDCRGTGYRGRKAIAEILRLNEEIRETIVERRGARQIRELAQQHGTRSLREACVDAVLRGETTVEELKRVTVQA